MAFPFSEHHFNGLQRAILPARTIFFNAVDELAIFNNPLEKPGTAFSADC